MSLLGIKGLIEEGKIQSKQYVDLVPESYPTIGDAPLESAPEQSVPVASPPMVAPRSVAEMNEPQQEEPSRVPEEPSDKSIDLDPDPDLLKDPESPMESADSTSAKPEADQSSYGPVRRRIPEKSGPFALHRPARMAQEDFTDLMREVVPKLIEDVVNQEASTTAVEPHPRD